jgi:N-acetylglucosamine-6-sulfatase
MTQNAQKAFSLRALATLVLFLVLALVATSCIAGAALESPNQPDIVLILTDDMRADDIEHMPKTQSLIVDQGLSFSNAFVTTSQCCPSRASILRGQYAHNHHVPHNRGPEGGFEKFRKLGHEESTVATWLDEAGYNTVLLGKYFVQYGAAAHIPPGWDEWYARSLNANYYDYALSENGEPVYYGSSEQDYQTDVLTRKATDFINRAADSSQPLFMYLAPQAPHIPYQSASRHEDLFAEEKAPRPPSFNEAEVSDKPSKVNELPSLSPDEEANLDQVYRQRLRMLQAVDDMVEAVVGELEAVGRLENTYVFFTSDNGYLLGEHRIAETKGFGYEESIKVPLAVRGPGIPAGSTTDRIALNTDLAPTFADLAKATTPDFVDGRSLRPVFASDTFFWRTAFLEEFFMGKQAYRAVRTTGGEKYVEYTRTGERELYDRATDPYELENRYQTADAVSLEFLQLRLSTLVLRSRLSALEDCAGETCRAAEDGL